MKTARGVAADLLQSGTGGGKGKPPLPPHIGVLPLDWFLKTMAPIGVRGFKKVLKVDFTNTVSGPTSVGTYKLKDSRSLVLTQYAFFAEEEDVGKRRRLLRPNDFQGFVTTELQVSDGDVTDASATINGSGFGGTPWLDDDFRFHEKVPIYIHGAAVIEGIYNVKTVLPFDVATVGLYLGGFILSSIVLKKALDDLALR